ncbi:MAG: hypothetical protein GF331_07325 [Chitinivibrionales bacterium]|nr:hypothetical protein [Chitinivibrionales bacterium]
MSLSRYNTPAAARSSPMRSPAEHSLNDAATDNTAVLFKASLLLLAVALNALELFIPRVPLLPWLKPGLANVITIVWLVRFGMVDTLLFGILRVWIVGFYFGFSLLTMALSLSGTVLATVAMGICWRLLGRRGWLGLVGLGIVGATFHNLGQLSAVYLLLARNVRVLYQAPFMAAMSVLSGGLVGWLAAQFVRAGRTLQAARATLPKALLSAPQSRMRIMVAGLLLGWSCAVMLVESLQVLTVSALLATLFAQVVYRGSLRALFRPLGVFWLLFVAVGALHAFFSYGRTVPMIPFATYEGLHAAGIQSLRLWTWLQLAPVLQWSGFATLVFRGLAAIFPSRRDTLTAGLIALEYFPDTLARARAGAAAAVRSLLKSPAKALDTIVIGTFDEIASRLTASEKPTQ